MYKLCFYLILAVASYPAMSAPAITSAKVENSQVIIEGRGFGSSNPMIFWDDVSSSYAAQLAKSGDAVKVGTQDLWQVNTNQWGAPFTYATDQKTRAISGSQSPVYFGKGHKNFLGNPHYISKPKTANTLYVSWWYKPTQHPNAEGGSNKFIRIWDDGNGTGTRVSWTQMHITCNDDSVSWATWAGKVNEWNHHEFYINMPEKKIVAKVNGMTHHNMTTCAKDPKFPEKPIYIELLGFDHGSTSYQSMTTAIDDIFIGDSQARVVFSDEHRWSDSNKTEVLPIVSWTDGKIVATEIDGVFPKEGRKYLYVLQSDGLVNAEGYSMPCPKCPNPPIIQK